MIMNVYALVRNTKNLLLLFLLTGSVQSFRSISLSQSNIRPAKSTALRLFGETKRPNYHSVKRSLLVVASATNTSDGTTEWTKPRLHNKAAVRNLALLAVLILAGLSSQSPFNGLPQRVAGIVHLLSFATWFGTVAYTTFVAGITMFQNLPRQTFGKLQAKLFPKYFALSSCLILLQLITLPRLNGVLSSSLKSQMALRIAFIGTVVNQFYLEPQSTNNMMERYQLEDQGQAGTDRYQTLKKRFGQFHGLSSLINLIALCAGVVHGTILAAVLTLA